MNYQKQVDMYKFAIGQMTQQQTEVLHEKINYLRLKYLDKKYKRTAELPRKRKKAEKKLIIDTIVSELKQQEYLRKHNYNTDLFVVL